MKDYAIFISLTENYVYLFNALYNSVELFGIGEYADFVVLHTDLPENYIKFMEQKTQNLKTKVRFVKIVPVPGDEEMGKVMTVKFYRYKIMAELGKEYKSILFLDSDIFFASGIKEYFDIAAATDIIVATNDNVVRYYKNNSALGTCPSWAKTKIPFFEKELFDGKFICNVPTFIDMNKYSYLFLDVFEHRLKLGMDNTWPFTGDLETMNLVMLKHKAKYRMLILPSHLWTGVHATYFRSNLAVKRWMPSSNSEISDPAYKRKFLFMSETCDHIRSFHGRDWTSDKGEESVKQRYIPKIISQSEGKFEGIEYERAFKKREQIFDLIQSYFLFLQFETFINLDEVYKISSNLSSRHEYLKKKQQNLESLIITFREV